MENIKPVLAILAVIGCFSIVGYMVYADKDDEGIETIASTSLLLVLNHYFSIKQSESKSEDKNSERDVKKTD